MLFIIITLCLVIFVQLSALTLAFYKLRLSESSAFLLFVTSLFGSFINLPIFAFESPEPLRYERFKHGYLIDLIQRPAGKILIAVNVGGCLVPVLFSIYLLTQSAVEALNLIIAITVVTTISYALSRPIKGVGIGMPMLVAPVTAAFVAILVGGEQRAVIAYISGVMGVLIGADILRIRDVIKIGAPFASIGGAGTFDGIFITGLIAVLLT